MADYDISLRATFKNEGQRQAKELEKDLKSIGEAAKKAGQGSGMEALAGKIGAADSKAGHLKTTLSGFDKNMSFTGSEKKLAEFGKAMSKNEKIVREFVRRAQGDLSAFNKEMQITADQAGVMGKAIADAKLDGTIANNIDDIGGAAADAEASMGGLGKAAGFAFTALVAFQSVQQIIDGLKRIEEEAATLERRYAAIAVTAEMRNPEVQAKMQETDTKIGAPLGMTADQILPIRNALAAAGMDIPTQDKMIADIAKATKAFSESATDTGTLPTNLAQTALAAVQSLGIAPEQMGLVMDQLAKGTKLGRFEADSVAKFLPEFAAKYQQLGFTGPQALAEIIATAQVVRMSSGSADEAGTNARNLYSKLTAQETIKNFKDAGVDLTEVWKKAQKAGQSYTGLWLDEVQKLTGGDPMKIGELVSDVQAGNALAVILKNRKLLDDFQKQIQEQSKGTIDKDWNYLNQGAAEQQAQYGALSTAGQMATGKKLEPVGTWWERKKAQFWNPEGVAALDAYKAASDIDQNEMARRQGALAAERRRQGLAAVAVGSVGPSPSLGDIAGMEGDEQAIALKTKAYNDLLNKIKDLKSELANRDPSGTDQAMSGDRARLQSMIKQLGDMAPAAQQSMDQYNAALKAGGDQAIGEAGRIAAGIKDQLSFTATPTIAPRFAPPVPAPAPGARPQKMSAPRGAARPAATPISVQINQHFHGTDPAKTARQAARQSDRAVRSALAGSLHDLGSSTA